MTKEEDMTTDEKFPKTIYVTADGEADDRWLNASRDSNGAEDGEDVAVYQLVAIKKAKITRSLV